MRAMSFGFPAAMSLSRKLLSCGLFAVAQGWENTRVK
jgi:hypothetical protein